MNILHITKYIGEQKKVFKGYDPLSNILEKPYIINRKADLFNIHLTFDVDKGTIRFDEPIPHHQETSHETYYYFGNNYGNNPQYYLVRELSKAYLFLEDIWTNLYKMLKKNHLTSSDLYNYLTIMKDKHLFIEIKDKNNRLKALKLNLELLPLPESYKGGKLEFHKEERSFLIDGKILSIGKYIALVNDANELHFTMIIPRLIMNQQSYILSQTKGYKELVKLKNHLTFSSHPKHNKRICYVCGQEKSDVDVSYTKKYTSINKLFITQKINYASQIDSKGHNDNYGMCNDCYEDLLNGEAEIENSFSTTIAGENVYILPEALLDIFSYDDLKKFKENVDIAFNEKKVVDWLKSIEANTLFNPHYTLNMIFYRKAQGSFVVLESIEDVPSLHLARLIESFKNEAWRYPTQNFSLGTIYHMIPVSKNNKDKQIDIKRVLSLYRMILSGYEIQLEYIFRLFTEMMEKGVNYIQSNSRGRYSNLEKLDVDLFIQKTFFRYLAFIHVLQRMDLLDQKIFDSNHNERGMVMSQKTSNWKEDMMNELTDMETFLERENFPKKGRALFYLGGLIYKIGIEQYKKSHKKKPILDKIDYQGMSVKSIEQLYRDVVKKLKQYNAIYYSTEHMMYKFHEYAGNFDDDWDLSESKNVFFILAGYAYQVKFRKFDNVKTEEVLEDVETNEKGDDLDDEQ